MLCHPRNCFWVLLSHRDNCCELTSWTMIVSAKVRSSRRKTPAMDYWSCQLQGSSNVKMRLVSLSCCSTFLEIRGSLLSFSVWRSCHVVCAQLKTSKMKMMPSLLLKQCCFVEWFQWLVLCRKSEVIWRLDHLRRCEENCCSFGRDHCRCGDDVLSVRSSIEILRFAVAIIRIIAIAVVRRCPETDLVSEAMTVVRTLGIFSVWTLKTEQLRRHFRLLSCCRRLLKWQKLND